MDTLVVHQKYVSKLIVNTINVSIIIGLVFSLYGFNGGKSLLASEEIKLANNAIVSPILNGKTIGESITNQLTIEERTKIFNERINQKYKTGVIINVDKGVKLIKIRKTYNGRPVKINIIEADTSLNPNLELSPALASDTFGRKNTITTIARRNNSIVAINGSYFKQSNGVPLGTLMINKQMYTGPVYDRVAMGIFNDGYDMARVQLNASIKTFTSSIKVDNINQPRMLATYTIAYTPLWGKTAPTSPKYGAQVAVSNNKVIQISTSPLAIPKDGFVAVGPAKEINKLKEGQTVKLDVQTIPGWENVNHIISGGPYLVKKNQVFVDTAAQKLNSIGGRNPRTAVGYTADNHLIIVTVDGREKASIGLTLNELANFMKSIGCYNAMNLDGGGSTVLYVNGKIANTPQFKGGIALSNALAINRI